MIRYLNASLVCTCLLLFACGDSQEGKALEKSPTVSTITRGKSNAEELFNRNIQGARILVFSKTSGFRHDSITAGHRALEKLAQENQFDIVFSEDADIFNDAELRKFHALVFLNTTEDILDENQQMAMERYIQAGGGFVGIHSAADTELDGDWHWYHKLVGGIYKSHPAEPSNVQAGRLNVIDNDHPATKDLPETFELVDEWYNFRDLSPFRRDLLILDEASYIGGEQGQYHPVVWYQQYDGGRSFYTALGHTAEIFSEPYFLDLLLKGLAYAAGEKAELDYGRSRPETNRFIKKTLVENLNEPISFDFFPNGDALIGERLGQLKVVEFKSGKTRDAGKLDVAYFNHLEMGLLGLAVDQNFSQNSWIYIAFNTKDAQGKLFQRLSRFKWQADTLDRGSEQKIIEIPVDENCCHTGGDIAFGAQGEIFFSTGDNTSPHDQNGYAPMDFRDGKTRNDAQRTAANTQDLRGKILRIIPQEDGSYKIPPGNLFADAQEGRPEIYVMGARNPFTLTYDKEGATLYYGDVGPDADMDSEKFGPRGYDEINRVTQAGNFGWPLIIANNKPYRDYDYAAESSGNLFNPLLPKNSSPRNAGKSDLPAATPALIWYPYAKSEEFPELGSGGRTALVADVYHAKHYPASKYRYPAYYDRKLFILDFMRAWVKVVSIDDFGRVRKIEPFAPQINYALPIDARFSPDGSLYVLEYGMAWFTGNPDARLARIEYLGDGNRPPVAAIKLSAHRGAAPLVTQADASDSLDPDGDHLTYQWSRQRLGGANGFEIVGEGKNIPLNFAEPGVYTLRLEAKDIHGSAATTEAQIEVGNAPASIAIDFDGNSSFFWPDTKSVNYKVEIVDLEDGKISAQTGDKKNVQVQFGFHRPEVKANSVGHQSASPVDLGLALVESNSCKACHQLDAQSIGPSFKSIAERYQGDSRASEHLVQKIATGGSGVWGEMTMPPFGHLTDEERNALVSYVLSLAEVRAPKSLPLEGKLALDQHQLTSNFYTTEGVPAEGSEQASEDYSLSVSYTDQGGAVIGPIKVEKVLSLVVPRLFFSALYSAESVPKGFEFADYEKRRSLTAKATGKWMIAPVGEYDLTQVKTLRLGRWISHVSVGWQYEIRVGEPKGEVVATGKSLNKEVGVYFRDELVLNSGEGRQKIFLALRSIEPSEAKLHLLDVSFHQ